MRRSATNYTGPKTTPLLAFVALLCLTLTTDAEAVPVTINASGTSTIGSWFFPDKIDYWASRWRAKVNADNALYRRAKAVCPGGYTIVSAPSYAPIATSFGWSGTWGAYTSTCRVTMVIECDSLHRGKFPVHNAKDTRRHSRLSKNEIAKKVDAQSRTLEGITTIQDLTRMIERNKIDGVDYTPFYKAIEAGNVKRIELPSAKEILEALQEYLQPERR